MSRRMNRGLTPEEIKSIHSDVVKEYADTGHTETGIRGDSKIEAVVELAALSPAEPSRSLLAARIASNLVAHHPFVDANKRTALNVAGVLYAQDGYNLAITKDVALILKTIGVNRDLICEEAFAELIAMSADTLEGIDSECDVSELAEWHRNEYRAVYDWLETN